MEENDLRTDYAVLKSEFRQSFDVLEKLQSTLEKLGEISTNTAKILAVHEERLNNQVNADKEILTLIQQRRDQNTIEYRDINIRITTLERSLVDLITQKFETISNRMDNDKKTTDLRVSALENWRWFTIGISVVGGIIIRELAGKFIQPN